MCKKRQIAAVDHSEFQGITSLLEARGMIAIKKAKETRLAKVSGLKLRKMSFLESKGHSLN